MNDPKPPDETGSGKTEGTAPATNSRRPLHAEPTGNSRSDTPRVSPTERSGPSDPGHIGPDVAPNGLYDLLWRLSGEPKRALVVGLLAALFLGFVVVALWLVAPHLSAVLAVLGSAGLIGSGVKWVGYRRIRQEQENQGTDQA